jgi:YfiH family protein
MSDVVFGRVAITAAITLVAVTSELRLRPFPFSGDNVTAVVTTRHGGVSTGVFGSLNLGDHVGDAHEAVLENRRRLAAALGVDRLTVADQQHGDRVAVIGAELAGRGHDGSADARDALPGTDAMVTDLPRVALATIVADCAPVVLFDLAHHAIGVAHCGRRGTVLGTLPKTIEAMRMAFGSAPRDLTVGIGPAIGADSYEIGDAEATEVTTAFRGAPDHGALDHGARASGGLLRPTRPGHWTFDMVEALRTQLRDAGVKDVHSMEIDTRTSTDEFFSDRAARPCGRFMAVAMLPE